MRATLRVPSCLVGRGPRVLTVNWTSEARELVELTLERLSPHNVLRLVDLLPGPWTPGLADQVLAALDPRHQTADVRGDRGEGDFSTASSGSDASTPNRSEPVRLGKQELTVALAVAERVNEQHVRGWAHAHPDSAWVDRVLVHLGDCAAEQRELARLAEAPDQIKRQPAAYDEEWVSHIRCKESTAALEQLISRSADRRRR